MEILYRGPRLIAVNKPAGLAVHRGWADDDEYAMTVVRDQIGSRVYPVHRLDRGTSGVLLFALDSEEAARVQSLFSAGRVEKRYRALVRGVLSAEVQLIDHPIPRSEDGPRVEAQTEVRALAVRGRYSWVEAVPRTGRLHQVRRHLKHISHPIIGDVRYGKGEHNRFFRSEYDLHRLALHACSLVIDEVLITAPLPEDLRAPLVRWGLEDP